MREEFKHLKRWVEECPTEACMRIEKLEEKVSFWQKRSLELKSEIQYYKGYADRYSDQLKELQDRIVELENQQIDLCNLVDSLD